MKCSMCKNKEVEEVKMKDRVDSNARTSFVGYHCHDCNRIKLEPVGTVSEKGIPRAFEEAAIRFNNV